MRAQRDEVVCPVLLPVEVVQAEVEVLRIRGVQLLAEGQHVVIGPGPFPAQSLLSVYMYRVFESFEDNAAQE